MVGDNFAIKWTLKYDFMTASFANYTHSVCASLVKEKPWPDCVPSLRNIGELVRTKITSHFSSKTVNLLQQPFQQCNCRHGKTH